MLSNNILRGIMESTIMSMAIEGRMTEQLAAKIRQKFSDEHGAMTELADNDCNPLTAGATPASASGWKHKGRAESF